LVLRADCPLEPWRPLVWPFSSSFSFSSLQSLEQWVGRQALDHFVERERLTLTAWLPARLGLQLLPQAKIAFGEK
jgi:hypothetical protein